MQCPLTPARLPAARRRSDLAERERPPPRGADSSATRQRSRAHGRALLLDACCRSLGSGAAMATGAAATGSQPRSMRRARIHAIARVCSSAPRCRRVPSVPRQTRAARTARRFRASSIWAVIADSAGEKWGRPVVRVAFAPGFGRPSSPSSSPPVPDAVQSAVAIGLRAVAGSASGI